MTVLVTTNYSAPMDCDTEGTTDLLYVVCGNCAYEGNKQAWRVWCDTRFIKMHLVFVIPEPPTITEDFLHGLGSTIGIPTKTILPE